MTIYINGLEFKLKITKDYETQLLHMPELSFKKKLITKQYKVPRIVVQTYETRNVTRKKYLTTRSIIDQNPNFAYHFYDGEKRRQFIKDNFNEFVLQAYDSLIPKTYQADIFRFAYLYKNGGVYEDCKHVAMQSYENLLEKEADLILAFNKARPELYETSILLAAPGIAPFKDYMEMVPKNITEHYYGQDSLSPTGPIALKVVV